MGTLNRTSTPSSYDKRKHCLETMKIEIAKMLLNIYIYDASISCINIMYNAFYVFSVQMQIYFAAGRDEAIIQNIDKPSFRPVKCSG